MTDALRRSERRAYRLDVNYRNPEEIFELAAQVIRPGSPDATLPRAVRSTGHRPRQVVTTDDQLAADVTAAVQRTLDEVEGDVGVIVPRPLVLAAQDWTRRMAAGRVRVVEGVEAKGLEFDGVVLVQPHRIAEQVARGDHLLYVALTRATQRLVTVTTDADWLDQVTAAAAPVGSAR